MFQVEVLRGKHVESTHNCSVAVVDADGHLLAEFGDIYRPIFPRSSIKVIQALPLVESGAAARFSLQGQGLALCCSSHAGENRHADMVSKILDAAGLDEGALKCGSAWPHEGEPTIDYARAGGGKRPLRHTCSGKHAGFLCLSCHLEANVDEYLLPDGVVQKEIIAALANVTGYAFDHPPEIDGCSAPTYSVPLRALAQGFARLSAGHGLGVERAKAAGQLFKACMKNPEYVGGTGLYDTRIMAAGEGKVFAKFGAEGVYCGALPELGIGIAIKCHDGSIPAAEIAFGCAVSAFHEEVMLNQDHRPIHNDAGLYVGAMQPASAYNS
ncbi:MAG: asparaginase [Hyphomicrobiales bacterium]